jgi:hypothetical protein
MKALFKMDDAVSADIRVETGLDETSLKTWIRPAGWLRVVGTSDVPGNLSLAYTCEFRFSIFVT